MIIGDIRRNYRICGYPGMKNGRIRTIPTARRIRDIISKSKFSREGVLR